jgi:Domain of unknown function (DUF4157)
MVSQPSDPAEREADEMAGRALADVAAPRATESSSVAASAAARIPLEPRFAKQVRDARSAGGEALSDPVRGDMERRFGRAFDGVRVHRDHVADKLAGQVSARAFTVGHDVFFRAPTFQPATSDGRRLIAHELAHVAQQDRAGATAQREVVQRQVDTQAAQPAAAPAAAVPAAAPGAPVEPVSNVELGILKIEAFQIQRKDERTWVAVISSGVARQIPAEQMIMLATVAVASALLRETDSSGAPTRPPPLADLLAIARDTTAVGRRVNELPQHPDRPTPLAFVNVHQSALDAIRTRLGNKVIQVPLAAKAPRDALNFPESFPQGFVSGAALETLGEPLHGRSITLKDLALMYAGFKLGQGEGVIDGIKELAGQIKDLFSLEFWRKLDTFIFETLPELLSDDQLQFDFGFAHGVAFAKNLRNLSKAPPFDFGRQIGNLVGRLMLEIVLAILSSGAVTVAKRGLDLLRAGRLLEEVGGLGRLGGRLRSRLEGPARRRFGVKPAPDAAEAGVERAGAEAGQAGAREAGRALEPLVDVRTPAHLAGETHDMFLARIGDRVVVILCSGNCGELVAKAERMVARLPKEHPAAGKLEAYLRRARRGEQRMARETRREAVETELKQLRDALEQIEREHPDAVLPNIEVAPAGTTPALAPGALAPGPNFEDHFKSHKSLLEKLTGMKYTKVAADGGRFLEDLGKLVDDGSLKLVGKGTLKKDTPLMDIYRGRGVTLVTKANSREFVTLLEQGEGLDLGIQLVPAPARSN